jgi:carbon monoxide dehydrogenase subunit G
VEIVRSIEIDQPVDAVFAFVADPRNDVRWCPKVRSVESVDEGRYAVVHKPVPGKPERQLEMTLVASEPPRRLEWREHDGTDAFDVTYELEDLGGRTRFTQRSVAELGSSRLMRPIYKAGIGRDIARQLKELRKLLEE